MLFKIRRILLICGFFSCLVLTGCGADKSADILDVEAEESPEAKEEKDETEAQDQTVVAVYVCGQVNRPGVYELTSGSRV